MEEVKVLNIYQKMSEVTNDLGYVAKGLEIKAGKGSYKAVSENDILAAVKPIEFKWGVYSYPIDREIIESKDLTNSYGNIQQFLRIKVTYRFINIDVPTEFVDMVSYGDGLDSGDKATGKGMTYADKYALMKAYKISTGDDPDAKASEEYVKKGSEAEKVAPIQQSLIDKDKELDKQLVGLGADLKDSNLINYIYETAKLGGKPQSNTEYNALIRAKETLINKKQKAIKEESK